MEGAIDTGNGAGAPKYGSNVVADQDDGTLAVDLCKQFV